MAKAVASQSVFCISSGLDEIAVGSKSPKGEFSVSPSFSTSQFKDANSRAFPSLSVDFLGKPMTLSDHKGLENCRVRKPSNFSVHVCKALSFLPFDFWLLAFVGGGIRVIEGEGLVDLVEDERGGSQGR